jgi:hypothetical protein
MKKLLLILAIFCANFSVAQTNIDILSQQYELFLSGLNKNAMTTDYLWNKGFYNTSLLEEWNFSKSITVDSEEDWYSQLDNIKQSKVKGLPLSSSVDSFYLDNILSTTSTSTIGIGTYLLLGEYLDTNNLSTLEINPSTAPIYKNILLFSSSAFLQIGILHTSLGTKKTIYTGKQK